mgnify:CR=1 FL=1
MNILDDKKGGRGKCQYCHKWHNNVSYHEELECDKRPWLKEVLDSGGLSDQDPEWHCSLSIKKKE